MDPTCHKGEDTQAIFWPTIGGCDATAHVCLECGKFVEIAEAIKCANWAFAVEPQNKLTPGPYDSCRAIYHDTCYNVSPLVWPTVLTATGGYKRQGRGARRADACRLFVCEICRVRAQCGEDIVGDEGERLRELERVRVLTRWSHQTDGTITAVASAQARLRALDATMPARCPRAAPRFQRKWPLPSASITLQWHQLAIMRFGGKGEGGARAIGSLKMLRTAMFNAHREAMMDNPLAIAAKDAKLANVSGAAPTDAVGNELFVKGLEATIGSKSVQADAMPPSVARALCRAFADLRATASAIWAKYDATAARYAVVVMYSCILRGDEPWKQRFRIFQKQPFLRTPCPMCGQTHALVTVEERVKNNPRGFDLVCATPTTGAGLESLAAFEEMLHWRSQVQKLLTDKARASDCAITGAGDITPCMMAAAIEGSFVARCVNKLIWSRMPDPLEDMMSRCGRAVLDASAGQRSLFFPLG